MAMSRLTPGAAVTSTPEETLGEAAFFDFLYAYERRADIGTLNACGVHLWPLVRSALVRNVVWRDAVGAPLVSTGFIAQTRNFIVRARQAYRHVPIAESVQVAALQNAPVLIFDDNPSHKISHMAGPYDRILDPILDIRPDIEAAKFHLQRSPGSEAGRARPSVEIPRDWLRPQSDPNHLAYWNRRVVDRIDRIEADFEDAFGPRGGSLSGAVLEEMTRVQSYRELFHDLLAPLSAKVLYLSVWASTISRGLIWACKDLGILTVDVQHGQQGRYSANYGQWQLPEDGFSLMPDVFWLWGGPSDDNLRFSGAGAGNAPVKLIGGNPYLTKWKQREFAQHYERAPDVQERMDRAVRNLLVTLQPFRSLEELVPAQLVAAIKNAPANWLWTIRNHPNAGLSDEAIFQSLLDQGCRRDQILVTGGRDEPLPMALRDVDWHLTAWSTCGYEALVFDTPTLFFYPFAQQQYGDYIQRGTFFYADTPDHMLDILSRDPPCVPAPEERPWIVADDGIARAAFDRVLDCADHMNSQHT